MKRFKGIKIDDRGPNTWNLHEASDLPANFANPAAAAAADPDAPSEGPDIRNNLKRFGQNINKIP